MTQLGERIAIGMISAGQVNCPFDHDSTEPENLKNELVGKGFTLGSNMEAGMSTVRYVPLQPKLRPVPNPDAEVGDDAIEVGNFLYPVWCAAHHLIPAQASLKKSTSLLRFMKKGGSAKLWSDIGYDVNGLENGVWLPGNYAVGGHGTGDWVGAPRAMDGDCELASVRRRAARRSENSPKLDGARHDDKDPFNRKWPYVDKATRLFNAQFHDAHVDYNKFVLGVLNKIGASLQEKKRKNVVELECRKCAKRQKKIDEYGVPPPFSLNLRLNGLSAKLRSYLKGRKGHGIVFTSRWGKLIGGKKGFEPGARNVLLRVGLFQP